MLNFILNLKFKLEVFFFKKLIKSKNAWPIFNESKIEGFGTNLIRLYFPIYYDKKKIRESFSPDIKQQLTKVLESKNGPGSFLKNIVEIVPDILALPLNEESYEKPFLDNYFFGVLDAAVLAAMLNKFRPSQIIEIGSGISTRYMKLFKDKYHLQMEIICIDPEPRAEISSVADQIINQPLENWIENTAINIRSDDILFIDGSHYVYQGNDTLTFFFKILPSIPSGVIIHIHDIYLPFDYAENVSDQLWAEQYILAALLIGNSTSYEILYPTYYISQTNKEIIDIFSVVDEQCKARPFKKRLSHKEGYSFWMKKL